MLLLAFSVHTAYRFQLAGYRDEKDYISIQKVDSVREHGPCMLQCSASHRPMHCMLSDQRCGTLVSAWRPLRKVAAHVSPLYCAFLQ